MLYRQESIYRPSFQKRCLAIILSTILGWDLKLLNLSIGLLVIIYTCEHHLLPIIGKAHVAYFSKGNVIGLSKMNRIVDYFSKRPQVQERLTIQVVKALQEALGTLRNF